MGLFDGRKLKEALKQIKEWGVELDNTKEMSRVQSLVQIRRTRIISIINELNPPKNVRLQLLGEEIKNKQRLAEVQKDYNLQQSIDLEDGREGTNSLIEQLFTSLGIRDMQGEIPDELLSEIVHYHPNQADRYADIGVFSREKVDALKEKFKTESKSTRVETVERVSESEPPKKEQTESVQPEVVETGKKPETAPSIKGKVGSVLSGFASRVASSASAQYASYQAEMEFDNLKRNFEKLNAEYSVIENELKSITEDFNKISHEYTMSWELEGTIKREELKEKTRVLSVRLSEKYQEAFGMYKELSSAHDKYIKKLVEKYDKQIENASPFRKLQLQSEKANVIQEYADSNADKLFGLAISRIAYNSSLNFQVGLIDMQLLEIESKLKIAKASGNLSAEITLGLEKDRILLKRKDLKGREFAGIAQLESIDDAKEKYHDLSLSKLHEIRDLTGETDAFISEHGEPKPAKSETKRTFGEKVAGVVIGIRSIPGKAMEAKEAIDAKIAKFNEVRARRKAEEIARKQEEAEIQQSIENQKKHIEEIKEKVDTIKSKIETLKSNPEQFQMEEYGKVLPNFNFDIEISLLFGSLDNAMASEISARDGLFNVMFENADFFAEMENAQGKKKEQLEATYTEAKKQYLQTKKALLERRKEALSQDEPHTQSILQEKQKAFEDAAKESGFDEATIETVKRFAEKRRDEKLPYREQDAAKLQELEDLYRSVIVAREDSSYVSREQKAIGFELESIIEKMQELGMEIVQE